VPSSRRLLEAVEVAIDADDPMDGIRIRRGQAAGSSLQRMDIKGHTLIGGAADDRAARGLKAVFVSKGQEWKSVLWD
jgi:hypothetical protein